MNVKKIAGCRLFNGHILKHSNSELAYKSLYCMTAKHAQCRRFLFSQTYGSCPDFILPNTMLADEQIKEKMVANKG